MLFRHANPRVLAILVPSVINIGRLHRPSLYRDLKQPMRLSGHSYINAAKITGCETVVVSQPVHLLIFEWSNTISSYHRGRGAEPSHKDCDAK